MITEINRAYGIIIASSIEQNTQYESFLDDLGEYLDAENDIDEYDRDWDFSYKLEYLEDMDGFDYGIESYYHGGGIYNPTTFGTVAQSWEAQDLMGPEGLIKAAQNTEPTEEEIEEFNELPEAVRDIFEKHNLKPEVIWFDATT